MGCNVDPEIILVNNRIPKKSFQTSIRYLNTEVESYQVSKISKELKPIIKNIKIFKISLNNIRSHYILRIVFNHLKERRYLQLISKNKKMQNKLDVSVVNYKNYKRIELEIELIKVITQRR